ncbi:MAG TPA: alkyl hydroperoxide reductase, partial [Planctomycetaceae bacterium]|nr:alkyl hydroperoxide reductase [Planctomycetaceae bacterium]
YEVETISAAQLRLAVPPRAADYEVAAVPRSIPTDARLLSFMPHMHLRGKSFRYDVEFPDGRRRCVLQIPSYDFNWQTEYWLKEPLRLPAGTRVHATAHFDNSEANLNNPDPDQTVRWGEQTWDEMMIGYFTIAVSKSAAERRRRERASIDPRARRLFERLDRNRDGMLTREEIPRKSRQHFRRTDRNGDGIVSLKELADFLSSRSK